MPPRQGPGAAPSNKPKPRRSNASLNKSKNAGKDTGMSTGRNHNGVSTSLDSIQIQPRTPRTPRPHREWANGDGPVVGSMDEVELTLLSEEERARAGAEDGFGDVGGLKSKSGAFSTEDKKAIALLSVLCECLAYSDLFATSLMPGRRMCRPYSGSSSE